MASTIYFNGRTTAVPGAYSQVDTSGLAKIGLGASGIVACIGEAEGAQPAAVLDVTNPGRIFDTFQSGDLLEAGAILFNPSLDPDIPGGAQEVKFVKVNPATQSSYTFQKAAVDQMAVTSVDYGLFTTRISVDISAGTVKGKALTVVLGDSEEDWDDIGGDPIFTAQYNSTETGKATAMTMDVHTTNGVRADFTKDATGQFSMYTGSLGAISGLDGDQDAVHAAGTVVSVVSSSASDTMNVTVYGISTATGLPATEIIAVTGIVLAAGLTNFDVVHGAIASSAPVGNLTFSKAGPVTLFVIDATFTSQGGCGYVWSSPIEAADEIVSLVGDTAAVTQDVLLIGTAPGGAPQMEEVTMNGVTAVPTTASWETVVGIFLGYVAAARSVSASGHLLNSGDTLTVVSSGADTMAVTLYGLDSAGLVQSESITLAGVVPVAGSATWSKLLGVDTNSAAGTITVSASTGTLTVATLTAQAIVDVDDVDVSSTAVTLVGDAASVTQDVLLIGLDATGTAQVEKFTMNGVTPVAGTSTWSELSGIAVLHVAGTRKATASGQVFTLPIVAYDTIGKIVDYIEALSGWTASVSSGDGSVFLITDMDHYDDEAVLASAGEFLATLYRMIAVLNNESQLVTAARSTGATGAPDNTAVAVYLAGGIEGTTLFSHWQAALDLIRDVRVNTIVSLTSDPAVHAAVRAHCVYAAGAGQSERDAVLGAAEAETLADLKSQSLALNTRHCRYAIQNVSRYNTDGELESFPPYLGASCIAAGMQAGSSVGTSLTHKYLNVVSVTGNDSEYTIRDNGEDLIQSGLLAIEYVSGVGYRWVRNVTTHQIDDNTAYTEASVNEAANYAIYEFRRRFEAIIGKKGHARTANQALADAVGVLGQLVDEEILTNWQNLTIELAGDVMTVDVEMAPIVPVNFVKITAHLVSSSLSLAA